MPRAASSWAGARSCAASSTPGTPRAGRTTSCGAAPPKSPPYAAAAGEEFEPYGVGYVELPGEVRVEARLTEADPERLQIGMPMELTLIPAPGDPGRVTFAFRPLEEDQ